MDRQRHFLEKQTSGQKRLDTIGGPVARIASSETDSFFRRNSSVSLGLLHSGLCGEGMAPN